MRIFLHKKQDFSTLQLSQLRPRKQNLPQFDSVRSLRRPARHQKLHSSKKASQKMPFLRQAGSRNIGERMSEQDSTKSRRQSHVR